jgi:transcriptional regulator with XRE-family HTH domain
MSELAERVRGRIREEMARRDLSQQGVADLIKWTQSRVAQKLNGRTPITMDELSSLGFAVGLQPTEIVRDRGLEFCSEMAPHELRVLERLRQLTPAMREAFLTLLEAKATEARQATPKKALLGKPRHR